MRQWQADGVSKVWIGCPNIASTDAYDFNLVPLKVSIFRVMEDTTWFESKSEEDKLTHLSKLMYSSEENEFKTLLSLVPVDLVTTIAEKWGGSK